MTAIAEHSGRTDRTAARDRLLSRGLVLLLITVAATSVGFYLPLSVIPRIATGAGGSAAGLANGQYAAVVTIPENATLPEMGDLLVSQDVVASRKAFLRAAENITGSQFGVAARVSQNLRPSPIHASRISV